MWTGNLTRPSIPCHSCYSYRDWLDEALASLQHNQSDGGQVHLLPFSGSPKLSPFTSPDCLSWDSWSTYILTSIIGSWTT
jgi:hypothetical protein